MANNYTHFAVAVPLEGGHGRAVSYARQANGWIDAAIENDGTPIEGCPIFSSDVDTVYGGLNITAEDGVVYISDDGGEGDVSQAADVISWLLRQQGAPSEIDLEWANTCSKSRPGEFGGGAARVLPTRVVWNSNPCTALDFLQAVTDNDAEPTLIPGLGDEYDPTAGVRFVAIAGSQGQVGFRCIRDDGAVTNIYLVASSGSEQPGDASTVFLYQDDGRCENAVHHYDIEFGPGEGDLSLV